MGKLRNVTRATRPCVSLCVHCQLVFNLGGACLFFRHNKVEVCICKTRLPLNRQKITLPIRIACLKFISFWRVLYIILFICFLYTEQTRKRNWNFVLVSTFTILTSHIKIDKQHDLFEYETANPTIHPHKNLLKYFHFFFWCLFWGISTVFLTLWRCWQIYLL